MAVAKNTTNSVKDDTQDLHQLALFEDAEPGSNVEVSGARPHPGLIEEIRIAWADGDTTRAQLERLAAIQRQFKWMAPHWGDKSRKGMVYRMLSVRVEGDAVLVTGELTDLCDLYGGQPHVGRVAAEEEEEKVA